MTDIPIILVANSYSKPKAIEGFLDAIKESYLVFYASDLLPELGYSELSELDEGLERAIAICESIHIPVEENIKLVFRDNHSQVYQDWKLSRLSRYLLMVNGRPTNPTVGQTQIDIYYKLDTMRKTLSK
ncbi:MAG: hypothetical protein ABJF04_17005 [Reichenbachiella sp.]|uniref:hypothetical protein n=1 Tax=Reichenbachiella sp. TaxID=2184521 RepID=UPI003264C356